MPTELNIRPLCLFVFLLCNTVFPLARENVALIQHLIYNKSSFLPSTTSSLHNSAVCHSTSVLPKGKTNDMPFWCVFFLVMEVFLDVFVYPLTITTFKNSVI
uniref:Secreted protein n=1 Tax=Seriola dumerili TaxID=41447 RepID=A0A3B4U5C6_SERDU